MHSLNSRRVFANQNAQSLIIDLADMKPQYLKNITEVIQNILTLSASIRGGTRIPAFSLSVLTIGFSEILELNTLRGNYNKIIGAFNSLPAYCLLNENVTTQDYKDGLYHAISTTIAKFTANQEKFGCLDQQVEVTLMTVKNNKIVQSYIEEFLQEMNLNKINKITIIELCKEENKYNENMIGFIQTITASGINYVGLQSYFKNWLQDKGKDIDLILHFPTRNLSIKCDVIECIINPLTLPFGHRTYLQTDCLSVQLSGISNTAPSMATVPVYELDVVAKLSVDAICESTIFGLPLCLKPTQSWLLKVEEDQFNQQFFVELCKQLAETGEYLLVKLRKHFQTDEFISYFVLTPGDGCLLLKSFATSDITLPWKQQTLQIEITTENGQKVCETLHSLNQINNLEPSMFSSGLYRALHANLKVTKRDYHFDMEENLASKRQKRNK